MIKRRYYFMISTAAHIVFAAMLLNMAKGTGKGSGNGQGSKAGAGMSKYKGVQVGDHVIPKEKVEITIIEVDKSPGLKKKQKPQKKAAKKCQGPWYGGIGMQSGFDLEKRTEYIDKVFPGYPADLAGLEHGDILEDVVGGQILGDPGTYVTIVISRKGVRMTFTIMRDRVCYFK